jgi:hypothetical protein
MKGMEEEQSSGVGSSGSEMDKGEAQQQSAEEVRHNGVGKRVSEEDNVEEEEEQIKAPEAESERREEGVGYAGA